MVPKLFTAGKSFKSLAAYLLHDPNRAQTSERIRWSHTLNLAADRPGLAVDEMLWTVRAGEALKRANGAAPGGRRLKNPVKHFSLNWHPSQNPSREHMIETVEDFLAHMKWQDHQALIVCHDDKHPHVHVMLNAVHPVTGRALDTSFERRRAQEWAAAYERENQLIFCEERLKPNEERTPSPTRDTWQRLRQSEVAHDRAELHRMVETAPLETDPPSPGTEWRALKDQQRKEREKFFVDGKAAYRDVRNAVFRDVRSEFREQWKGYYEAKRSGDAESLQSIKAAILEEQRRVTDDRRQTAAEDLRRSRDAEYTALLKSQKLQRHELKQRQDRGERTELSELTPTPSSFGAKDVKSSIDRASRTPVSRRFKNAASELTGKQPPVQREPNHKTAFRPNVASNHLRVRGPAALLGGVGLGLVGALGSISERLFDGFFGGDGDKPPEKVASRKKREEPEEDMTLPQTPVANDQTREAELLQAFWEERRERKRNRD